MTTPGFASRDTTSTFRQFPQKDEAAMATIEEMHEPGWSNKQPTENDAADAKVVDTDTVEDKAVTAKKTASKSTAKKV